MFVRALLSREFLISAAVIVGCGGYFSYQLLDYQAELELLHSPQNQVSLTQDALDEISFDGKAIAAVTDFEFYGKPFSKDDTTYQLLAANSSDAEPTGPPLIIALSYNLDGDGLRKMITSSKGGGIRLAHELDDVSSTEDSAETALIHPDYPGLDLTGLKEIGYKDLDRFSAVTPLLGFVIGGYVLAQFTTVSHWSKNFTDKCNCM